MCATTPAVLDPAEVAAGVGELPTLAPVALEVLRLADDNRASLEDIAAVIGRDPALAGQILRVANSAVYGMGGHTTGLARAASVLGLRTVKLLSLSFSVITRPDLADARAKLVWRHTLATSAMARVISTMRDPRVADECFIVGLLSDLGRIALADHPAYSEALRAAQPWLDPEGEMAAVGCTSDAVTAHILAGWGLPAQLSDAVRHRSTPGDAHGAAARIARVLNVADAAARVVIATPEQAGPALEQFRARAAEHLDLTEDETDTLLADAGPALAEIAEMFRTEHPNDVPVDVLLRRAKASLARLSLETVVALSQETSRSQQLTLENRRLTTESTTDALTGLANRRAYEQFLDRAITARERRATPGVLGLLMIDIDRFKSVNDTHGHPVGDDVLRLTGARLALHTRTEELAARIGGEEFVVVVPTTTPEEIRLIAERLRAAIADDVLHAPTGQLRITVSIGAAWLEDVLPGAARRLYEAADAALRTAKQTGRNRVVATLTR
ncbi:MAG: diguanylate cyclase [Cellulomonas sp.]